MEGKELIKRRKTPGLAFLCVTHSLERFMDEGREEVRKEFDVNKGGKW